MHMAHAGGEEVLPWFRVMTAADPHFIRGYRIGTMWLLNNQKWPEAYDFIQEGIRNNQGHPELYRLYTSLITYHIKYWTLEQDRQGSGWVAPALEAARTGVELGLAERPPLGEEGVIRNQIVWTRDQEEDFLFAARYVPILERRQGRIEEALQSARRMHDLAPGDAPLMRIVADLEDEVAKRKTPENEVRTSPDPSE